MKRFFTFFCLTLVAVTIILLLLTSCNMWCIGGAACGSFWVQPATETAQARATMGSGEFRIQLTALAEMTVTP